MSYFNGFAEERAKAEAYAEARRETGVRITWVQRALGVFVLLALAAGLSLVWLEPLPHPDNMIVAGLLLLAIFVVAKGYRSYRSARDARYRAYREAADEKLEPIRRGFSNRG